MEDTILAPKERIAVLIGKKGEIKRKLERITNTKIIIDSKDSFITIKGEAIDVYNARPIIKAIARGFNPEIAELLNDEQKMLEIISLNDFGGKNKAKLDRLRSRCIGKGGGARKNIEIMTNTNICIYGKTVGVIGEINNCQIARQAIENLLNGAPHGNVYKWIEKRRKEFS